MKFTQLFRIFWARRMLAFTVLSTIVGVVLAVSLLLPKTYIAKSSVVISSKNVDPITGAQVAPQQLVNYVQTQINVIGSRNVAFKVIDGLHLVDASVGTGPDARDRMADKLLRKLEAAPTKESSVISIGYSSGDPQVAALIANAFARAYIEASLELTQDPARRQSKWFDEQLQELRNTLETAQARLSESQRARSIVGTDEKLDIENSKLNDINTQLGAAQARMYEAQNRFTQVNKAGDDGHLQQQPEILSNPLLQNLKAELVRAQGKLADISEKYGHNHPQYMSAQAEIDALQEKINREVSTTRGSIGQSAQIAQRQVSELQSALDAQKQKILELKGQHDEVSVLNREVENAQRAYDSSLQRATQVRMESQMNQTNIAVLDAAIVPGSADHPKVMLNVMLALVLGSMLAAGCALATELVDRRVCCSADLEELGGLIVLAEIPRVSGGMQRRLLKAQRQPELLKIQAA
jgi:chain length determinant protein EpsF